MKNIIILLIAVILDYILGDPHSWPHPVVYIGKIIKKYEDFIRKNKRISLKLGGFVLVLLSISTVVVIVSLILYLVEIIHPLIHDIISVYLIYTTLAAKCLYIEAKKVYRVLKKGDIGEARKLLSYLVGRDTTNLSSDEITRGVVETVAENTIDGVLAPMIYIFIGFILGIPVQMAFIYKTINTLDSMVGYIQEPYREIGYTSAKLDDIANFIPARIGSIFMLLGGILLGYDGINGLRILRRDKRNHKSPNCGYPESTVAGLLKVQLGGTNTYFGEKLYKPIIGDSINSLIPENIIDATKIMFSSQILMSIVIIAVLYVI